MLSTAALVTAQTNEPPRVHEIKSVLEPPFNYYSIEALDPELKDLTFTWSISNNGRCDAFTSQGATATWRHDDEERCPHEAGSHPGTITVVVSDGVNSVTRTYTGGSAPFDPGEANWRTSGVTFFGGNETGDDPRDMDPPAIYGEELDCPARDVAGAFEPVQSVWQDENTNIFPEDGGRRLTIHSATSLEAELPLVVNKLTQLFGIRSDRTNIYYNGTVTGDTRVAAVVRWTLKDTSGDRVLGEIAVDDMFLGGSQCATPTPFAFKFNTTLGLSIRHFLPDVEGGYTIEMALAERGGATVPGSEVIVMGDALKVREPRVYFIGTIVNTASPPGEMADAARRISNAAAANVPDYYPLPAGGLHTNYRPNDRDARGTIARAMERCSGNLSAFDWCRVNAASSAVESLFGGSSWILRTRGGDEVRVDRIGIVVSRADMDGFLYPPARSANGFASATKVFYQHANTTHFTTAHELAHTVPEYPWLHPVGEDCTIRYHNNGTGRGHGFQLSQHGAPVRIPQGPKIGLMQGGAPDRWIEQCTYHNLLHGLRTIQDPTLVGVRGWIAKDGTLEMAAFEPGMTFAGGPDREPGGEGRFAIVLLDGDGATLAEHRFDHPFTDDHGRERPMISFTMAIERPAGLARIELRGESGLLASRVVTPNTPTLTLSAPDASASPPAGQPLRVAWSASDADGDALTYGVAFSPDEGETWYDVDFDINTTEILVPPEFLALGSAPVVRVMATDGVNSAEVDRPLGPRVPTPTPPPTGAAPTPPAGTEGQEPASGTPGPGALAAIASLGGAALVLARRKR